MPQLFSRVGRYTLTCYALVLILTGPATNTFKNSEVLSESMACSQVRSLKRNTAAKTVSSLARYLVKQGQISWLFSFRYMSCSNIIMHFIIYTMCFFEKNTESNVACKGMDSRIPPVIPPSNLMKVIKGWICSSLPSATLFVWPRFKTFYKEY